MLAVTTLLCLWATVNNVRYIFAIPLTETTPSIVRTPLLHRNTSLSSTPEPGDDLQLEILPIPHSHYLDLDSTLSLISTFASYLDHAHRDLNMPYSVNSETVEIMLEPSPEAFETISCQLAMNFMWSLHYVFEEKEAAYPVRLRIVRENVRPQQEIVRGSLNVLRGLTTGTVAVGVE